MALDLSRAEVMIVNPSRGLQQILRQVLWDVGLRRLRVATAGGAAFRELADEPADLIFVDFVLADGPGTAFVRRLRRMPDSPAPFCPVIMTIAHPTREKILAARDNGADEVVTRPVTVRGVMQKLVAVVDRPRGMVLAPGYIGPDRRRGAAPGRPPADRRERGGALSFEVAAMPLLQMKQRGERAAAERLVTDARQLLRALRTRWIDSDLDGLAGLLAGVPTGAELEALRPELLLRLEAARLALDEHGYPGGARIVRLLLELLQHGEASDRTAQLLKVNIASLRAVVRSDPGSSDALARDVARSLGLLAGAVSGPLPGAPGRSRP